VSRDRDVRNAIQAALMATSAFDAVWIWGLPENYGSAASQMTAAAIEPQSSSQDDKWDSQTSGGLVVTSRVGITFLYRADDPQVRDEGVELLLDTAANALNGTDLIPGFTIPAWTRFRSWTWQEPQPPERRIISAFEYQYEIDGWDVYDVNA
jgi:hypothetical protein